MVPRLLFLLIFCILVPVTKNNKSNPTGLMIEFIREPVTVPIMDLKPEFSWIVPEKAFFQTSYQILVASSKVAIENNIGDIWDSQKVRSKNSTEIEFAGGDLTKNTSYFWKVKIWDYKDRPSEYSDIQSFRTGSSTNYLTTPNRFLVTLIPPVKLIRHKEDNYFIDFGKDAFGTVVLNIDPVKDDTIIVHLGEKINGGKIDRKPDGSIRYQKVLVPVYPGKNKYILNLSRDTRNTGPSAIQLPDSIGIITPFRYCELENCNYDLKPADIKQRAYSYFFDDTISYFSSSDTILNKVWDISRYSIKATSFAGIYIDGDRERIPYEADAYINQLGHYCTDREYSMARITNEYFIKHPTWPTEWILHTVPMFYNDLLYTGNIESIRYFYNELKNKTLVAISRRDGLISSKNCTDEIMKNLGFSNAKDRLRDIVDWPPSQKDTGWKLATSEGERDGYEMVEVNTVVNAFYYRGLICMADISGILGKNIDSDFFREQASIVKRSFNEKFLNKNTGIYTDGESSKHSSLHANMTALAFGLVPEENKKSVIEFIESRGMACSVYGAQYLLEGLYNEGEADYAFSLLTSTNNRSWWNMIRSGSTITMEAWDMKYKPNSDWNHAWGAAPANIIPRYLWGIIPVEPGFAKTIIKPQLCNLKKSKITLPTIRGSILAEFSDTGRSKEFRIIIPANMVCDFVLEKNRNVMVRLNNKLLKTETGIIKLNAGLNSIVIKPSF